MQPMTLAVLPPLTLQQPVQELPRLVLLVLLVLLVPMDWPQVPMRLVVLAQLLPKPDFGQMLVVLVLAQTTLPAFCSAQVRAPATAPRCHALVA